ncbi:MAG: histidinol-phosphate transaminase [Verrucomicrobiales bacterium]|nr:histidinol-phosphate transaminase [Verrucomicrobiales bacterium]|tara:strand:+ start:1971 stop:3059 length:1089 start_codon:yes stop_codon:yes gene_type:complete
MPDLKKLIRPLVHRLHAYVPGEQPKDRKLIKLNTNENPFPPAPAVLRAVKNSVDERLRLYPNPNAQPLREALASYHGCGVENVIVGNGSDELLALATRAFVEPDAKGDRALIQYFHPSYSLYPVLTDISGGTRNAVSLDEDFSIPSQAELRRRGWRNAAALTYVTTPNAPGGRGYSTAELDQLCQRTKGIVILDEAYVDFAEEHAMSLALKRPHVIVSRTFSKSFSLCFQRIGYFVGHPDVLQALDKIRDSYNVNGLGQAAALATLKNLAYYRKNFRDIKATRARVGEALTDLGFKVLPSQTNFLLIEPPRFAAKTWHKKLREKKLIVRWFDQPETRQYFRVTIGTDREMDAFLRAVRAILK